MVEQKEKSVFDILNAVDVSEHKEEKDRGNGKKLSYLSWAWAWTETKKRFPDLNYTVYENSLGYPYHTDGRTAWIKCGVTIQGVEQIEYLSIMDNRNQSIPLDKVTSTDVIRTLQRCVTKAIGRHGLGLYIYAGEDLPENVEEDPTDEEQKKANTGKRSSSKSKSNKLVEAPPESNNEDVICVSCLSVIDDYIVKDSDGNPKTYTKQSIIDRSMQLFNKPVCMTCMMKAADKARKAKDQEVNENA